MRALVRTEYGGPEVVHLAERPIPEPGKGRVRVRVEAAGLNMADHHAMTGEPLVARAFFGLRAPKEPILGMDLAGTVDALGPGVTGLAIGDRVVGVGGTAFAEYALAKAELLVPLPAGVSAVDAAALPTAGMTALDALAAAGLGEDATGTRVLVTGAGGGVGAFLVQLAAARGAVVTAVCSGAKAELVRSLGASEVIDYALGEPAAGEADVVLDFGGARDLATLASWSHSGGVVILGGGENGGRWLGGASRQFARKPRGGPRFRGLYSAAKRVTIERLVAGLADGTLRAPIEEVLPLERGPEAFARLDAGKVRGKLVLSPGGRVPAP